MTILDSFAAVLAFTLVIAANCVPAWLVAHAIRADTTAQVARRLAAAAACFVVVWTPIVYAVTQGG